MSKIDGEEILEALEDSAEELLREGYSGAVVYQTIGRIAESLDDAAPIIDRLIDERGWSTAAELFGDLLNDPERKARRLARFAFRDAYELRHLPAMSAEYDNPRKAARKARRGWRRAWRKSPERKAVKS